MTALAPTPPMGWNSWDSYGTTITEAEVLANAEFMHDRLLAAGWNTVVIDAAWFDPFAHAHGYNEPLRPTMDAWGRLVPTPNRFPSAGDGAGFGPLARAVREFGLRFGIHVMRGIPREAVERDLPVFGTEYTARQVADVQSVCPWNRDNYGLNHAHPGAQAYYDAQVAQYAEWGIDYLKVDDMLAPYHAEEIEAFSRAIARSRRPIVLSLSPGTGLSTRHLDHLRANAQMWRISDDLWDRWDDVYAQFARLARWAPLQEPGGWADADMLPLGRIGLRAERGEPRDSLLTLDEQRTVLTLWVMARSPLMVGGDLPSSDGRTVELLANPWLGRVLSEARDSAEILREPRSGGEHIVWAARSADPDRHFVALFSTVAGGSEVSVPVSSIVGENRFGEWRLRDLWTEADPTVSDGMIRASVPEHGVRWYALEPAAGE
ncbi:glycoside hydrolase family 27 protein [Rathayibacter sp. KR2-224]|uniref:glycoside hydrolase family 27 protein n=1 Tax=Rathayibacter sp. KR2-224 TaxID=3400913 RepID=UPI003C0F76E7